MMPWYLDVRWARAAFVGVLLLFALLYAVLTYRDTWNEFELVFDRRLLRRYVKRFSLRALFVAISSAGVAFAIMRSSQLSIGISFGLVGLIFCFVSLLCVAVRDVMEPPVRRKFRDKIDPVPSSTRSLERSVATKAKDPLTKGNE